MPDQSQTDLGLYKPPQTVRGITELDRAVFSQTVCVPAIRIPTSVLNKVVRSLKKVALQRPGLKRVVEEHREDGNKDSSEGDHRLLLLDPNSITSADSFGSEEAEALKAYGVPQEIQKYELKLTYENLKSEEILRAVLPEGQDVTSGFSRVGHIAHMNLRDHQLPYRKLIGEKMNKNYKSSSVIVYLPSCHHKPECILLFCGAQKEIFWKCWCLLSIEWKSVGSTFVASSLFKISPFVFIRRINVITGLERCYFRNIYILFLVFFMYF